MEQIILAWSGVANSSIRGQMLILILLLLQAAWKMRRRDFAVMGMITDGLVHVFMDMTADLH